MYEVGTGMLEYLRGLREDIARGVDVMDAVERVMVLRRLGSEAGCNNDIILGSKIESLRRSASDILAEMSSTTVLALAVSVIVGKARLECRVK